MLRRLLIASACAGAVFLTPAAAHAGSPEPADEQWLIGLTGPSLSEEDDRPTDPISRLVGRLISTFR